ncbi:DUF2304 domain-containing protein [bacterium]|nr:DUF2304 domain-containing protein [bacterium]NCP09954.1 DUF2304 domain-containing protein [bacterium]OIP37864.1 MAG: hypothetical protein AUK25_13965 [Desulfobacteraceae bacterium CG2_30_51_40]
MISYRITSIFVGAILFLIIIRLVRKGKLQERHSILWFVMAVMIMVLAFFPQILDKTAGIFGIHYAPNLLLTLGLGILLVQNLYLFLYSSRHEARIRELAQQVALLKNLLEEIRDEIRKPPSK